MMSPAPLRTLVALTLAMVAAVCPADRVHPQDGPHAEIRISIDDQGVGFSIGINLAFIDEAISTQRESLGAVHPVEADAIRRGLEAWFRDEVRVEIDGVPVLPIVATYNLYAEPNAALLVLYPRLGMRALIRAVVVLDYPTKSPPQVVKLTWPTYPIDMLAAETEPGVMPPPRMFFEAQLRAEGTLNIVRFSEAQPTVEWRSTSAGGGIRFDEVPVPAEAAAAQTFPAISSIFVVGILIVATGGLVRFKSGGGLIAPGLTVLGFGVLMVLFRGAAMVSIPGTSKPPELPTPEQAEAVFKPLHANLYRAFDYTEESDVYDALEASVHGQLLEELYTQVYGSLIQAEQGGLMGVITGIEPLALTIADIRAGSPESGSTARFMVTHRWRVAGTVYHWGHSHTRVNEYSAEYDVAALPGGWKITGHRVLEQRRLDPPGLPPVEEPEI